ncbi:MAG TPA: FtsX-like permease family protein [Acidimicrobiia bacterium]|nr:FtsX-like permease family protein [Acidimicrobiia bacterium]
MTAVAMWVRADLRARWRSWVLLGLLAGVTFGVAAAGVAGARRTANAVPAFAAASHAPSAAVLANDPSFDAKARAAVAALPEVHRTFPFLVGIAVTVLQPRALADTSALFPSAARSAPLFDGVIVQGRAPNPRRADEVVVDEYTRDTLHLSLGSRVVIAQTAESVGAVPPGYLPPGVSPEFRQPARVVGISKSVSSDLGWSASNAFYAKYHDRMPGFVNMFVNLRRGERDVPRLRADVQRIVGHPVNVERASDLLGIRKAENVTSVERDGLLLFALAALLGGGVLVGQALVRAVAAGTVDFPTWRAIGVDRGLAVRALVLPTAVTAGTGAVAAVVTGVALSSRFPIGVARRYDLDVGIHADTVVLAGAALALVVSVLAIATGAAWWGVTRGERVRDVPSTAGRWVTRVAWSPALTVGSRLAVEPGRGRRAVPVRSAMVGAVVGVLGVVACFTFRAGIDDALAQPARSGVVWDSVLASGGGLVPRTTVAAVARDRDVAAVLHATWHRAVPVDGTPVPVFGTSPVEGDVPLVVLDGRAPRGPAEIAFAPTTMRELHTAVGGRVRLGNGRGHVAEVVGEVLLPATSHTDYDQSGWMTAAGVRRALGHPDTSGEDYLLVRWRPGADAAAAQHRIVHLAGTDLYTDVGRVPVAVEDLGRLATLPLVLGIFFALLACATVAHALVTTVRRRRRDFAVLRSFGFTRGQSRLAIAWQATMLAAVGVVVGVPLGIAAGRTVWRWLADEFPVAYVPPLALVAVVLAVPVAIAVANVLAAWPARSAAEIRPAETLRTE